jgi:hypothetical protein
MKTTLALAVLLFGSVAFSDLLAQGQLQWGNNIANCRARIYGPNPANPLEIRTGNAANGIPTGTQTYAGTLLAGTGFTAGIYVGRTASEVMANNTTPQVLGMSSAFGSGASAGLLPTGGFTAVADGIPGGTVGVNYQLRVWDNRMGTITSWAAVMAAGGMIASGTSEILVFAGPLGGGSVTPPLTDGIRSFQLTAVPEPSLIALGALGLGALLLRRRK